MADDERVPTPGPTIGHFLPGGAGDQPDPVPLGTPRTALTPAETVNRRQLGLGKARPVGAEVDPSLKKAAALPSDPEYRGFGAPPSAPLAGAPVTPLRGGKQVGGARPVGWNTMPTRTGLPQFDTQPPDPKGPRRFSRPIVGLLSALALVVVAGAAVTGYQVIDSFDRTVANPLAKPTVRSSAKPVPIPPPPTVTETVQPVPDAVRLQKNGLYGVGKLASVNCALPKVKPDSKTNVLRFYQAVMPCLHETWEPLVLKAGYPFRQPKLVLATKTGGGACSGKSTDWVAYYCGADETMTMKWEQTVKYYKQDPVTAVNLLTTIAHEYSHHVQLLTNILVSSASQEGWAKTKAAELEWSRRLELQADCLGAVFLSANKKALDLQGERLRFWVYGTKNGGDDPKKDRDHGSRKSAEYWATRGFATADPASCNTYTAPAAKVS